MKGRLPLEIRVVEEQILDSGHRPRKSSIFHDFVPRFSCFPWSLESPTDQATSTPHLPSIDHGSVPDHAVEEPRPKRERNPNWPADWNTMSKGKRQDWNKNQRQQTKARSTPSEPELPPLSTRKSEPGSDQDAPLSPSVWSTLSPTQQRHRRKTENKGDGSA